MLVLTPRNRLALLATVAAALMLSWPIAPSSAQTAPVVRGPNAPALAPAAPAVPDVATPQAPVQPVVRGPHAPALAPKLVAPKLAAPKPFAANPTAVAPEAAAPAPEAYAPEPVVAAAPVECPGNPNALGVARTVEIDTTGGPGFGFEHFKIYDFLRPGEVVLTFDDGPWPRNTPAVLAALSSHCAKATFFPIGKHAMWHPDILRQVAEAGHTVGSHTWSHADLSKKGIDGKVEIEKGASAVKVALGAPPAPFFRFPALRHPADMMAYVGERNLAVFSTDIDSFDFKTKKPEVMVKTVMAKLQKNGKGIILMHDFQAVTAKALPELLEALKAGGYRIVHIKAKDQLQTIAEYDAEVAKDLKGAATAGARPASAVFRTIEGN